jgi:dihydrofolate reductase
MTGPVRRALIVAVASNGVIGRDGGLPWHLPSDLRYFRTVTMGKPVIMGRLTWESIGRPLPGRTMIVVTSAGDVGSDQVLLAPTLAAALAIGERELGPAGGEVLVIGGAHLYAEAIDLVDRIYLTEVHAEFEGDTRFAKLDGDCWREVSRRDCAADADNPFPYSFVVLERR